MNILLIQADATTPSTADQNIEDWLEARYGASGTISTGTITTYDDSSAAHSLSGIDLIVVGPSADQSQVASKYDNRAPAITLAGACWRQTAMDLQVGSSGSSSSITQIRVVQDGHALAGGLANGLHTVFTSAQWVSRIGTADLPAGISHIIEPSSSAVAAVWAIDVGGSLGSGAVAAYRQVAWGLARDGTANANATFDSLLEAAVSWAAATSVTVVFSEAIAFTENEALAATGSTGQLLGTLHVSGVGAADNGDMYAADIAGDVIATTPVAGDGSWAFSGLTPGVAYRVWGETDVGAEVYTTQERIVTVN